MIDMPADATSTADPSARQLILLPPKTDTPPPKEEPAHSAASHGFTFVCALLCILTVTIIGINLAAAAERTSLQTILCRLSDRAFFGCAVLTVTDTAKEEPLPETDVFPSPDTDIPEEASPQTTLPGEITPPADGEGYPIEAADLSGSGSVHALFNETDYVPDTAALLSAALPFPDRTAHRSLYGEDAPYILILHTHGTESFAPEGTDTYKESDAFRSTDTAENVVAVGTVMAEALRQAGIPVLHLTEMFDFASYNEAYTRSAAAVRKALAEHPSIQIVLDVHRDSIIRTDKTKIRPVTTVNGAQAAQFMLVVGTDFKGAAHPAWQDNLNFALKIQSTLLHTVPKFARSINLRGAGFNQQYAPGSLLLEVGSCGNTLDEAKRAGVLAAIAIADVVTPGGCDLSLSDVLP